MSFRGGSNGSVVPSHEQKKRKRGLLSRQISRRSLDDKGDLKEEAGEKDVKKEKAKEAPKKEEARRPVLPEVDFSYFLVSLSSSALFHLGEIADPQTGQKSKDLPLAKHSIDIIAMLKEKTKGNLTEEEDKALESILTDLRWRYVKAAG
jgi:hypothetical protein